MDQEKQEALRTALRQIKMGSKVKRLVEAEDGDFKVVISGTSIDKFYKGETVDSVKVAELDNDVVETLQESPDTMAQFILEDFSNTYAPKKKEASSDKKVVEAAHDTVDEQTAQMVTQKQLEDRKPSLHPRTDEYPTHITQRQLPEDGQRPGTYDVITQGQLTDEKSTFYGEPLTAGQRKAEDRNVVTEGQFDEGVDSYSEVGQSERHQMGAEYDGDVDQQWKEIGEKQLEELLSHHEWKEPFTITEGKDQLGKQDGELARVTAETAQQVIKEALDAMGNTVLSAGIRPDRVVDIVRKLVGHSSKYPVMADTINRYKGSDVKSINEKVADAKYFGKTANVSKGKWSDFLVADILVRQLAKMSHNPTLIVQGLTTLAGKDNLETLIDTRSDAILAEGKTDHVKEAESTEDISGLFETAFNKLSSSDEEEDIVQGSAESDGLYSYTGAIDEVKADISNKEEFANAAFEYAKEKVAASIESPVTLNPEEMQVDPDKGTFQIIMKDASFSNEKTLETRAEKRREMTKEAQMGGAGAMPPAGGPEMGNPAPPAGAADMGAPPPTESLSQPAPEDGMESAGGSEPKPPGSSCPICGADNVDFDNGELRCNECGTKGDIFVQMNLKQVPGVLADETDEGEDGLDLGEKGLGAEDIGMGDEMDEGQALPNVPVAASVKVTPLMIEKIAQRKVEFATVCPGCGSSSTDKIKSAKTKGYDCICWDCGQEYKMRVLGGQNKPHSVYAQYVWMPKSAEQECSSCTRLKSAFVEALENYGTTWKEFDSLPTRKAQADLILKMATSGTLNLKSALKEPLQIGKFAASNRWKGYDKFDKFPIDSCVERLSRRWGENATAMSGACQGKKLAECVCGQLNNLGIYTDGLAAKVASNHMDKDPRMSSPADTCISMFVHEGYTAKQACTICDGMRAAYASMEDLVLEKIASLPPAPLEAKPMKAPTEMMEPKKMKPMMGGGMSGGASVPKPMDDGMPSIEEEAGLDEPMDDPMDVPVSDEVEGPDASMEVEIEGEVPVEEGLEGAEMGPDMGDDMGGDFEGLDVPGTVTINLPEKAVDAVKFLMDALLGTISDSSIDTTGDEEVVDEGGEDLDVSDVTEDTVDVGPESEEDIPGLVEDEDGDSNDGGMVKSDDPSEGNFGESEESEEPSDMESKDCKPCVDSKPMEAPQEEPRPQPQQRPEKHREMQQVAASNENNSLEKEASLMDNNQGADPNNTGQNIDHEQEKLLAHMKKGTISKTSTALDQLVSNPAMASIVEGILKQADQDIKKVERTGVKEDKITVSPAQDTSEIGKIKDGGSIGHEDSFTDGVASKPDVPRQNQLIGDEGSEMNVDEKGMQPTVPHGSGTMRGEGNHEPEKGNLVDGNQGAQTQASSGNTVKTAEGQCPCGNDCTCDKGHCNKCCDCSKKPCEAKSYKVTQSHKIYNKLVKKANAGEKYVDLADGNTYLMIPAKESVGLISTAQFGQGPLPNANLPIEFTGGKRGKEEVPPHDSFKKLQDDVNEDTMADSGMTLAQKLHAALDEFKKATGSDFELGQPSDTDLDLGTGAGEPSASTPVNVPSDRDIAVDREQELGTMAYTIDAKHKLYPRFAQRADRGDKSVKLANGKTYNMVKTADSINLHEVKTSEENEKIKKESDEKSLNNVKKLEDDPDINQSGKTHSDQAHSLAVTEPRPSEGMSDPEVPEAPEGGQLSREHTVDKATEGPTIPTGGGMNADYDQNEKNTPEKTKEILGKENDIAAMANNEEAIKVAGQMLKAGQITADELSAKIEELSKVSAEVLEDYKKFIVQADVKKGLQKEASAGVVESNIPAASEAPQETEQQGDFAQTIQSFFTLNDRNKDYERLMVERPNPRLY